VTNVQVCDLPSSVDSNWRLEYREQEVTRGILHGSRKTPVTLCTSCATSVMRRRTTESNCPKILYQI
jgi:hypothetical protein